VSTKDQLAAKARQLAAKRAQEEAAAPSAAPAPAADAVPKVPAAASQSSIRVKPVRVTVDLSPGRFAAFKTWAGEAAVELGRSRLTNQDVVQALVSRLLTDETLARKIKADLREASQ
jgi:hypothetical protein